MNERRQAPSWQILFAVFGGPLAWFLQLNAGFALASNPCFFDNQRSVVPQLAHDWTFPAMVRIAVAAVAVSIVATLMAWRAYRLGRIRFLALWGLCLGTGSAILIVVTALAFFLLPRCAG
jgi:hypothetical protein